MIPTPSFLRGVGGRWRSKHWHPAILFIPNVFTFTLTLTFTYALFNQVRGDSILNDEIQ